MENSRLLPGDVALERMVLGIIISVKNAYSDASQIVDEHCFYDPKHQEVYKAICEIEGRGDRADLVTTVGYLVRLKSNVMPFEVANMVSSAGSVGMLGQYCQQLKELALYRRMHEIAEYLNNIAFTQSEDVFEAYTKGANMLTESLSSTDNHVFTIKDAVKGVYEQIDRNCLPEKSITGIATGFSVYDKRSGGLQGSDLVVIAAETSQGKTSLALSIMRNASLRGARVAVYSLEMKKEQLASRLMAMESGVPANEIMYSRLVQEKIMRIHQTTSNIYNANIYFDERSNTNISNILSSVRSLKIKYGIDFVVVDYLQLVGVSDRGMNKEQQVAHVARSLKNLAKELDICIVLLSQLSRSQSDPVPRLSRLRDSGQIEEAADVVMFIYRPDYYGREYPQPFHDTDVVGTAMIDIAKGRNIGLMKFIVGFRAETTEFYELGEVRKVEDEFDWLNG